MSSQSVFVAYQLSRKKEFSTITSIEKNSEKLYVLKTAVDPLGEEHLSNMMGTYSVLMKTPKFLKQIRPVPIKRVSSGQVQFPYVRGSGAERLLIESILEGREDDALAIITTLLAAIDALPAKSADPTLDDTYQQVFGTAYRGRQDCVAPGIVDLNLDNIIVDEQGVWHFIDYEWAFPMPVPKLYIQQRFFMWFFVLRYQTILRYHAARVPLVAIGPNVAVPAFIYQSFSWAFKDLTTCLQTESKLQEHVTSARNALPQLELFKLKDVHFDDRIPPTKGYIHELQARLDALSATLDDTKRELRAIHESRTYRLAKNLARAKSKLSSSLKRRPNKQ